MHRTLLLPLAVVALSACGPVGPTLTLVLDRADDAPAVERVRLHARAIDTEQPEAFAPFTPGSEPELLELDVKAGQPFYVDVWGCESGESCMADQVTSRGCTGVITVDQGGEVLEVMLQARPLPEGTCPPPVGEAAGDASADEESVYLSVDAANL